MAILDEFDPRSDGWFFGNWGEAAPFTWDLYRRTYLAINPSHDPIAAPLDSTFFEIFKNCASGGNCGGMVLLAIAAFKYGGFFGYGSPVSFYTGPHAEVGPDRADLHETINIMQARQFSAPGIRNFLDVVAAGELNDGFAAWTRIQGGLGSGDYHLLSLSNGIFGDAAHTIVPYRATQAGGTRTLWVWDPNRPYDGFPAFYDLGRNRIDITGPTSWVYDQNGGDPNLGGTVYAGSNNGWFFAIPTSAILHKARQPISLGFIISGLTYLFVSGTGAALTQIEDDEGRRLFTSDSVHTERGDLETAPSRRLPGVAPWPWVGGLGKVPPGALFVLERPPGSAPLNVTVKGADYRLQHVSASDLVEIEAHPGTRATDKLRLEGDAGDRALELTSTRAGRRFDIRHVRVTDAGEWRGVRMRNAAAAGAPVRLRVPAAEGVEISCRRTRDDIEIEFERFRARRLSRSTLAAQPLAAGKPLVATPGPWEAVPRGPKRAK
jgi:hypothetical protein